MDFSFWIKFIEIPVIGALFGLIWNLQRQLTAFKLEVAKDYINREALKHLEETLVERLKAIEAKLERWTSRCAPAPQKD